MNTTTRIFLAGIAGPSPCSRGASIAHEVLPLGEAGVQNTMDDDALLAAMKTTVKNKDGLYIYLRWAWDRMRPTPTKRSDETFPAELEKNPSGFFIYHPAGSRPMNMGKFLTVEFVTELC